MTPLPVVYDGVQQPALDIVSIPALPTLAPQYKPRVHNQWLRQVLSHQIPHARIMAFQYGLTREESDGKDGISSWKMLLEHAIALLLGLTMRREGVEQRPIIFVCHSFGAFILKKALLVAKEQYQFRYILESTGGVVFLGCLHDESNPHFEDLCIKCAAVEFGTIKKTELLKKSNDWYAMKEVMEQFRTLSAPFQVRGFFELRPTMYQAGRFSVVRKSECLCPRHVSSLGWENEEIIGVEANHEQIITYPHRSDEQFFDIFMSTLEDLVDSICPASTRRTFPSSEEPSELSTPWEVFHSVSPSASHLSILSDAQVRESLLGLSIKSQTVPGAIIPCFVTTPYEKNPEFVGRDDILEKIHHALAPTDDATHRLNTFVLAGLGGLGKTQIAIEYAFRYRDIYPVVLLAHADGEAKLAESYSHFAQELGLASDKKLSPEATKQAVKECLATLDVDWLMIIDNADGEDKEALFKEYLPEGDRGAVLITTRDLRLIAQKGGIELKVLDKESAVNLLIAMSRFNGDKLDDDERIEELDAAVNIVRRIDYLPLAIMHAANLIISDSCTFSEFSEAYNNRELIQDCEEVRLINQSNGSTYRYSLRTVWNMNFDRLEAGPRSLIKMLSYMDPDRVQLRHLTEGVEKAKDPVLDFMDSAYKRNKLKTHLLRSSLVTQSEKHKELRMHRLVQASCHLRMDLAERRQSFQNAITIIKYCWPVPPRSAIYDPSLWDAQQALLPHVQSLCAHYVASCKEGNPLIPQEAANWDFAAILYEAGWYCYERALLGSINGLLLPAEEYCLLHLDEGGGYRILADVYGGLGSLHTESNMFYEAHNSFRKEWGYLERAFETGELERPSIWEVFGLARLANGLHGLNRYKEAEEYYCRALKAWDGLPGDRTVYTTNLGTCLWLQGRLDDAEKRLRPLVKDKDDATNFRTGYALLALGNVQISQAIALTEEGKKKESEAKYEEAMETHLQSLKLYTLTIGPKHHRTADTYHKVGWHFHRRNNYDAALSMLEKALEIYMMNPEHLKNEIARTRYKRGCLYQDMGERQRGTEEIREAEKMRREIIGPENWKPAGGEEDFDAIVQFWSR
ncbi:uncharacterized protein F4822DRAFT_106017 [Hypoxylon trugodes]|uniref:uncharacterized protein n=1 Tax=Hypoxylon trugodes TaxID=326681 RepID=UPI002194C8E8|nr:uncharacterized protein F4822DRAFT_106017 [Hypoxylon trugodes]KAI1391821.1 hypothetical protein F4822DRAFT_106017 [Hypoxylon trugodes]